MTKESMKRAFQKALSDHMLLNLGPEEEDSVAAYEKSAERIRMEQERDPKTSDTPTEYVAEERYWVSADHPTPWVKGKEILGPFEGSERKDD